MKMDGYNIIWACAAERKIAARSGSSVVGGSSWKCLVKHHNLFGVYYGIIPIPCKGGSHSFLDEKEDGSFKPALSAAV